MYMPGSLDQSVDFGRYALVQPVEAYLSNNDLAAEYHELGTELANGILPEEVAFLMDETAKAKHLKNNIELIETLLPIISAAVLVIGGFISGVLISHSSLDIAVMRMLGTTKRRTRWILIAEQLLLCVCGIGISALILKFRKASAVVFYEITIVFVLYFAAILIFSAASVVAATRKNVLELLQTKE